ncbi:MAG: twin-arginine translocase TatA/TatE family subunit [Planctomycetes bacterium]|nr:twin-arginine translocase TatA/TatE family subunit [Planctomycetota bacterium]
MGSFGMPELLVILFIVLLLFGAKKIPGLMRSLGMGIGEFKKGMSDDKPEGEGTPTEQESGKPGGSKPA